MHNLTFDITVFRLFSKFKQFFVCFGTFRRAFRERGALLNLITKLSFSRLFGLDIRFKCLK